MSSQLVRSRTDRMVSGVCGGLAKYLGIDPALVRLAFVLGVFVGGVSPLVYIVLWLIMQEEPAQAPPASVIHVLPDHPRPVNEWKYDPVTGQRIQ